MVLLHDEAAAADEEEAAFTFHNKANKPVFVYNFPYQSQPPTFPLTGGSIGADQTLYIEFVAEPIMRINVADNILSEIVEKGRGPDGGNPDVDGDFMCSLFICRIFLGTRRFSLHIRLVLH